MTKNYTTVAGLADAIREFVKPRKIEKAPELFMPMPYEWTKSHAWPEIRWLHVFQARKNIWCVEVGTMEVPISARRPLGRRLLPQFVKSFSVKPEYLKGDAQIIKYVNEKKDLLQKELTPVVSANIVSFIHALGGNVNLEVRMVSPPPYHHGYVNRTVAP